MKRIVSVLILALVAISSFAQQEYKATTFGARSDGETDNTNTIQYAIDFISAKGGGTLVFYVGRYVCGAVNLKDNVAIRLAEAAVIVGSSNIYNFRGEEAIFNAKGVKNAGIIGKGVIEGNNADVALISLEDCSDIRIEGLKLIGTSKADIVRKNCSAVTVEGVTSTADGTLPKWKTVSSRK